MKKLLLVLSILIATNLVARMNPFEPTETFHEQQQEYLKQQQLEAKLKEEELQRKQQEAELLAQQQAQQELEMLAQQEQERKLEEEKKLALSLKQIEEKKQLLLKKDTHQILPFVKVEVMDEVLNIMIDKRYSLINQDILEESNKFLFDFRATESFYTVRKELQNFNFKSVAVGTHLDKNFFRVVVELTAPVTNYKETIDNKHNTISIKKIQ